MDAERARLVARGGDDAAAIRLAADRERLAAQRRVVALLDRRVERVHVDVEDAAHGVNLQLTINRLTDARNAGVAFA